MPNKIYAVTLHVNEVNLGTVLSALAGSSSLVSVVPTKETAEGTPTKKNFSYAHGKRDKGISGKDLALQILGSSDRVFLASEVSHEFVGRGFAANSAYAALSILVREGKVRALGASKFCLPGTTVKL